MNNFVLITGASSGFGKALVYNYAKKGKNLLLVARRKEVLKEIAKELTEKYKVQVEIFSIDLCAEEAGKQVFEWSKENNYGVELLINNAGSGYFKKFVESDIMKQLDIVDLNIKSVVNLTYYFLKEAKRKDKELTILNVASVVAYYPLPNLSIYAASKAFVLSFTQAIAQEVKATKTKIYCLCPGDMDTEFFMNAAGKKLTRKTTSPNDLAEFVTQALTKKKSVIQPGIVRVIAKIPRSIMRFIIAKVSEKEASKGGS